MAKFILDGKEYGGSSGSSSIELTRAEYNALVDAGTVNPETVYYIKDDNKGYNANSIVYSGENSGLQTGSVQNAIDELSGQVSEQNNNLTMNTFGERVELTSYTAESPYTAPVDGIMRVNVNYGPGLYAYGYINNQRMIAVCSNSKASNFATAGGNMASMPIRKGMKLYGLRGGTNDDNETVYFFL